MPNKDGTGPQGAGPRTGRQMGNCEGTTPLGYSRGFGRGFGPCGRGMRRGFWRTEPVELSREQKTKILEAHKAELEAELEQVKKEIKNA